MNKQTSNARGNAERIYIRRAEIAVDVLLGRKWSVALLCSMRSGPIRIGQLSRALPGASKKVLIQSLRELEAEGVVVRKDMSDLVLHVEYEINSHVRESIIALLDCLSHWGALHLTAESDKVRSLGLEVEEDERHRGSRPKS